jgi:hypothetical protein
MKMKIALADLFLDYFNNYLTIEKFAEHNEMEVEDAKLILQLGLKYHEQRAAGEL